MFAENATLRKRLHTAPKGPGVYRWLDADGGILYVGKAKNLRSRLRSYLGRERPLRSGGGRSTSEVLCSPWKQGLLREIVDVEWTVVGSELEALILETNLIKHHRPKWNVLMKDDKNYVYVRIAVQDAYPAVEITRRISDDGAAYFGPFLSARDTERTLDFLHELFPYRACKESLGALNRGKTAARACIDSQIDRCIGLCDGRVSQEQYRSSIDQLLRFFRRDRSQVMARAAELMAAAAKQKKFERAAHFRDVLTTMQEMLQTQAVSAPDFVDADIIGASALSDRIHVILFHVRGGKLVDERSIPLKGSAETLADALQQFVLQFYADLPDIPPLLVLGADLPDHDLLEMWMTERRGGHVELRIPERGRKVKLLELAERNACERLKQMEAKWEAETRNIENALYELKTALSLPEKHPRGIFRIEGYDISHLSGTQTVGSMVVMIDGKPQSGQYRSFIIRTMREGDIDDCKSLKEVIRRRLRHAAPGSAAVRTQEALAAGLKKMKKGKMYVVCLPEKHEEYAEIGFRHVLECPPHLRAAVTALENAREHPLVMVYEARKNAPDASLKSVPDLLVMDGGKGQLAAAVEVLREMQLTIPVVSLAKKFEEIFVPGHSAPLTLGDDSPARFLLMRLRDEAHRFANRLRETRTSKAMISTSLSFAKRGRRSG